ncbi:MAG TPA: DUF481 domain-containing protein [Steroidobacteraceae bacterium]|nr:DUF481 domain-containing protein [Steroidobacteraceae bacterium]
MFVIRHIREIALALLLSSVAATAQAQWTGKGEAGLVIANGNTDTKTANAKFEFSLKRDAWKHTFGADGIYAKNAGATTGQRFEVYEQSDYNFSARSFAFGALRYEDDHFSGFRYQETLSTGLGRHIVDSEATKLTGTVGVGYKHFATRDVHDPVSGALLEAGDSGNQAVFRSTLDFEQVLTSTAKLTNKFLVESGSNNTFIQNDLAVQLKVTQVLAVAVGYGVRRNSSPPNGFKKTDTLTTINLVYELK